MGSKQIFLFFLLAFFFASTAIRAQESLKEVLNVLEDRFDCQFNYLEETVQGVQIEPPDASFNFEESLEYLRSATGLTFNLLDDQIVSITAPQPLTLCGYVIDRDRQVPLESVTVQGIKSSVITDANGYFSIQLKSMEEEITLRHLGYKTVSRKARSFITEGCHPVFLTQQQHSLSEVVLANYLVEGISKLNTGELEIDFDRFNLLPGLIEADVLQAVQAFPGIQSVDETVSNLNIRGGTHDQNLILWDDIKMYQSGHFFGLISVFNPQITQKVSLRKNGTSSDYSDGVSGTIAMETNADVNSEFNGNLGIDLIDACGFVDVPIGQNNSVQLAARKSLSDIVTTPTYDAYFQRIAQDTEVEENTGEVINTDQNFDFYDASLRWLSRISDKDRLRLNFIYIDNELVFDENAVVAGEETSRQSSVSQNSIGGGLHYERKWNDEFQTLVQVYETDYKLQAINANLLRSQRFLQENVVSETGARVKGIQKINDLFVGHLGYQFIETKITNLDDVDNPNVRTLISEVIRSHGAFTQVDYNSRDRQTTVNLGFRYNFLDKFNKHSFEPRLSIHQKFANYFSVDLSGELKHQVTSQIINFQNDFMGVEKRRWQLANDQDVPVIESKQASLAVTFSKNGWLVSAEGYFKQVDGITTQSQGFQNQYEFVKTAGSYQVNGVDLLIRKRFMNTNIWLSYSNMNNEYTFDSLPEMTFPSNLDITHTVTLGVTYQYQDLKVASGLNWHTGNPTTQPIEGNEVVGNEVNFQPANSGQLMDYLRLDASALYEFNLGKTQLRAGVSVWNILDAQNEINQYYRVNENGQAEDFVQSSLGLTPNVVLQLYF